MSKVRIETFLSIPTCSGGISLSKLLKEIESELGDKVKIIIYRGRHELYQKYNLTAAPAVVIGGLVRIMGVCPSKETLITALLEAGLD